MNLAHVDADGRIRLPSALVSFFAVGERVEVSQHRWHLALWRPWRKSRRSRSESNEERITSATDCAKSAERYYHLATELAGRDKQTAMYLAGYAVECRLKSIICAKFGVATLELAEYEYSRQVGEDAQITGSRGHDFETLARAAHLWDSLTADSKAHIAFLAVNTWSTSWRYGLPVSARKASGEFLEALSQLWTWLDEKE